MYNNLHGETITIETTPTVLQYQMANNIQLTSTVKVTLIDYTYATIQFNGKLMVNR